jgi:hypothetical protein
MKPPKGDYEFDEPRDIDYGTFKESLEKIRSEILYQNLFTGFQRYTLANILDKFEKEVLE